MTARALIRVHVDADACIGSANCEVYAPEVFEVDDHGVATVLVDPVPEAFVQSAQAAVEACPQRAISLRDGE